LRILGNHRFTRLGEEGLLLRDIMKCSYGDKAGMPSPGGKWKGKDITDVYPYQDEDGKTLFEVVRFEPKDFRQRLPNGKWGIGNTRRVLYRLPEVIDAVKKKCTVYIVEGEKDVHTLETWGLHATCCPGGGGKWKKQFSEFLRGANVTILPDADKTGREHAAKVNKSLTSIAPEVNTVELPGAKDVSEWVEKGGTKEEFLRVVKPPELETFSEYDLNHEDIAPLVEVIKNIAPEGLSVLAARPKKGKSTLAMNFARAVTSGKLALGEFPVTKGECLYIALEDGKRRLDERFTRIRGKAKPSKLLRCMQMGGFPRLDKGGVTFLECYIQKHPNLRLVVIDTWVRVKPRKSGNNVYDDDADSWKLLHDLANCYHIAILVLHHTKKQAGLDGEWIDDISGTSGITGTVDTIMVLQDGQDEDSRTLRVKGRDVEEASYNLKGDKECLTWKFVGDADRMAMSAVRREILDYVTDNSGKQPWQIARSLGKNESTLRGMLRKMIIAGELRKEGNKYFNAYVPINTTNKKY
jgi:5S rRNA maturation endonuclease (ribonuclease M5)